MTPGRTVPAHLLQRNRRPVVEQLIDHPYDPDRAHKRGCFPCCRWAWLLRANVNDAERELHRGGISANEFEAYMHVWATAVPRFSTVGHSWTQPPSDPDVVALVDAMRLALKAKNAYEEADRG